jgi:hypothetical protein
MFRSLRLAEAFEYLVTRDEWHWFGSMVARGSSHFDVDGWPLYSTEHRLGYDRLWGEAASRAMQKLRAGEWLAEGISPRFGARRQPIEADLWDYIQIVHRTEVAEGSGFRFLAITVSDVQPARPVVPYIEQATIGRKLTEWIRTDALSATSPRLRGEQLAAARETFADYEITENLFRDCRKAAGLPEEAVQRGRPKKKG